ncbi:MAG: nucleotide disphospho-sugar-binding domain-containing protein [Cyanobacteria bacterium J06642_2]
MARIVFITSGYTSILNANFELARRLQAAGHQIEYASSYDVGDVVSAQGLHFIKLPEPIVAQGYTYARLEKQNASPSANRWTRLRTKITQWLVKIPTVRQRRQEAMKVMGLLDIKEGLASLSADLFLIDIEFPEYVIAATALSIPVALLSTWISLRKRPGLPPLHHSAIPGEGPPLQLEWLWLRFRLSKWRQRQRQRLRTFGCDRVSVLGHYAREVGVTFWPEIDLYQWLIPFSYRTIPVLSLNAYEFDFPHQPHPTFHYVGPSIALTRQDSITESDRAVRQHLEKLIDQHRNDSAARALIYCAFGTFSGSYNLEFLQNIINAIASEPQWTLILSLGGNLDPQTLGHLPANVRVFPRVPQLFVLENADCAIVHAGINTINECIYFGVPMLVYSVEVTDQNGNAARVAYHSLGIRGDRHRDDAMVIQHHLHELLTSDSIQTNVKQMQTIFHEYAQEDKAVQTIEALMASASHES